jgi:hypothetical protein
MDRLVLVTVLVLRSTAQWVCRALNARLTLLNYRPQDMELRAWVTALKVLNKLPKHNALLLAKPVCMVRWVLGTVLVLQGLQEPRKGTVHWVRSTGLWVHSMALKVLILALWV